MASRNRNCLDAPLPEVTPLTRIVGVFSAQHCSDASRARALCRCGLHFGQPSSMREPGCSVLAATPFTRSVGMSAFHQVFRPQAIGMNVGPTLVSQSVSEEIPSCGDERSSRLLRAPGPLGFWELTTAITCAG